MPLLEICTQNKINLYVLRSKIPQKCRQISAADKLSCNAQAAWAMSAQGLGTCCLHTVHRIPNAWAYGEMIDK